ncbi:MAG: flagellar export protein FliJ [Hyphomicrobiaceae bacterium]|nr:MAG: flagellar export protein FliJ [Hyphomicrobiaceae bacterium]
MKSREALVQLARFKAEETRKKIADLEVMVRDFELMAGDLDRQIEVEHERTGVRDINHFAYSTFAKAAAQRRANLRASVDDLKAKLDAAKVEHDNALVELRKHEHPEERESTLRRRSQISGGGAQSRPSAGD